jgi:hypothetical protein
MPPPPLSPLSPLSPLPRYASLGNRNIFQVGKKEFQLCLSDVQIVDESSPFLSMRSIDLIFISANLESDDTPDAQNAINDDNSLVRAEYVLALLVLFAVVDTMLVLCRCRFSYYCVSVTNYTNRFTEIVARLALAMLLEQRRRAGGGEGAAGGAGGGASKADVVDVATEVNGGEGGKPKSGDNTSATTRMTAVTACSIDALCSSPPPPSMTAGSTRSGIGDCVRRFCVDHLAERSFKNQDPPVVSDFREEGAVSGCIYTGGMSY